MNNSNSMTSSAGKNQKICPVCGKRSYSHGGIHPQCSMDQADAPRKQRLAAERKASQAEKRAGSVEE